MEEDTGLPQNLMEEDLMTYTHLLGQKKGVSIEQLINAIKFCNLKRTRSNVKSWAIVFPKKYDRLVSEGKGVDNHVSMYQGSWLVQQIDKEMLIPVHMQYAGAFHQAMSVNMRMMNGDGGVDANGERISVTAMVRHLAAKTILEITKQPEESTLNIKVGQSDAMLEAQNDMNRSLEAIVSAQEKAFRSGKDVAELQKIHVNVIEAEIDNDKT